MRFERHIASERPDHRRDRPAQKAERAPVDARSARVEGRNSIDPLKVEDRRNAQVQNGREDHVEHAPDRAQANHGQDPKRSHRDVHQRLKPGVLDGVRPHRVPGADLLQVFPRVLDVLAPRRLCLIGDKDRHERQTD